MKFDKKLFVGAALAGLFTAAHAQAATLTVDGGWTTFLFGESGSIITDEATGDSSYDFLLAESAVLKVTDAYIIGDVFEIFDNGVSIFTTGPFDLGGLPTTHPEAAFNGSVYSHGSFVLGAGSHSITGVATSSPTGSGGAFIELTKAAVPEPAAWAMMIAGFGMVGQMVRRRRSAVAA